MLAEPAEIPATDHAQLDVNVPAHTADKAAKSPEKRLWTTRLGYAAPAIALVGILAVAKANQLLSNGVDDVQKPNTPLSASHAKEPTAEKVLTREDRILRLAYYRKEAEDTLTLKSFYEDKGDVEGLQRCLKTLQLWKAEEIALKGEPRFIEVGGLVDTGSIDESVKKNFWERVNAAIKDLNKTVSDDAE